MKVVMNYMFVCRLSPLGDKRGRSKMLKIRVVLYKMLAQNLLANINLNSTFLSMRCQSPRGEIKKRIPHKTYGTRSISGRASKAPPRLDM